MLEKVGEPGGWLDRQIKWGCAASTTIVKELTKEMVTVKSCHDEKPRHTENDDSGNDSVCDQLCDRADTHRPEQQSAQRRDRCRKIQANDPIWLSINAEPAHQALHLPELHCNVQSISTSIEAVAGGHGRTSTAILGLTRAQKFP
jgi:hypothetical protein